MRTLARYTCSLAVLLSAIANPLAAAAGTPAAGPICLPEEWFSDVQTLVNNVGRRNSAGRWYSASRQKTRERFALSSTQTANQYTDYAAGEAVFVLEDNGVIIACTSAPITEPLQPLCLADGQSFTPDAALSTGGLLPLQSWRVSSGDTSTYEALTMTVGEAVLPVRSYERRSATRSLLIEYWNLRTALSDAEFELPCTPIRATSAKALAREHGLELVEGSGLLPVDASTAIGEAP
jgi:hypothetical protein